MRDSGVGCSLNLPRVRRKTKSEKRKENKSKKTKKKRAPSQWSVQSIFSIQQFHLSDFLCLGRLTPARTSTQKKKPTRFSARISFWQRGAISLFLVFSHHTQEWYAGPESSFAGTQTMLNNSPLSTLPLGLGREQATTGSRSTAPGCQDSRSTVATAGVRRRGPRH